MKTIPGITDEDLTHAVTEAWTSIKLGTPADIAIANAVNAIRKINPLSMREEVQLRDFLEESLHQKKVSSSQYAKQQQPSSEKPTQNCAGMVPFMKIEAFYKTCLLALLGGILVVQCMILRRMPPAPITLERIRNANASEKQQMIKSVPWVRVQAGSIEIDNTPLDVQIVH